MSKEFGINRKSVLDKLDYFKVASGALVPDIMHDVLEGVLQYETKILLQEFIQKKGYIELATLNNTIETFEFGYAEINNKPSTISHTTLTSSDNSLKQNGLTIIHVNIL